MVIHLANLKSLLEECGALQFGDFTLASGAKSKYYIDIKKASTRPEILKVIAQLMAAEVAKMERKPKRVAGVVLGSIPLATALSLETGIPSDILLRRYRRRFPAEMVLAPVSQEEASRFALSNRRHRFLGLFRRC